MSDSLASIARAALAANPSGVYLNTAAEGLMLESATAAWGEYSAAKSRGSIGRGTFAALEEQARARFATAIAAPAEDVAFVASTSRGLDIVLKGIDWREGDVLVTVAGEFPSTLFNLELLRARGVRVRVVASDGVVRESDIIEAIDERTRLVVASMVSFRSGQRLDFTAIGDRAQEYGCLVFADAVQAVGAGEVTVRGIDLLCAATFKWQLGVHGAAGFYASPRARALMLPGYAGYRSVVDLFPAETADFQFHPSARRFEEGMPAFPALAVLNASLAEIESWGYRRVGEHNQRAARILRTGLHELGAELVLADENAPTGGIVAFTSPEHARIGAKLAQQGTTVWARDGRVRLAAHAYTTDSDLDTVLTQLRDTGV